MEPAASSPAPATRAYDPVLRRRPAPAGLRIASGARALGFSQVLRLAACALAVAFDAALMLLRCAVAGGERRVHEEIPKIRQNKPHLIRIIVF